MLCGVDTTGRKAGPNDDETPSVVFVQIVLQRSFVSAIVKKMYFSLILFKTPCSLVMVNLFCVITWCIPVNGYHILCYQFLQSGKWLPYFRATICPSGNVTTPTRRQPQTEHSSTHQNPPHRNTDRSIATNQHRTHSSRQHNLLHN